MKKLTIAAAAIWLATFLPVGASPESEAVGCESCASAPVQTSNERDTMYSLPKGCTLSATEMGGRVSLFHEISKGFLESKEFEDGYGFRIAPEARWLQSLTEIILRERECCTFLQFAIVAMPNDGPIWFEVTGSKDVKRWLKTELGL